MTGHARKARGCGFARLDRAELELVLAGGRAHRAGLAPYYLYGVHPSRQ
jgi:hypothetical protein